MFKYIAAGLICLTFSCFADLDIGERFCSPTKCYEIKKILGEGAFGRVFQIKCLDDKKNYALKVYTTTDSGGNDYWALLGASEREFQRGKMLKHPNIVKSIELFTNDSTNLILEYVDGHTLSYMNSGSIPYAKSRSAAHQLIEALSHGVSVNLLHLDLHAGNVMLTKTYDTKVIDLASFFTIEEILSFEKNERGMNNRGIHRELLNKELKIQQFFDRNPNLTEELLQIEEEITPQAGMRKKVAINKKQNVIYRTYFASVIVMCMEIIDKADISSEKKSVINEKINALQQEYGTLVENGKIVKIGDYFNKLKKAID